MELGLKTFTILLVSWICVLSGHYVADAVLYQDEDTTEEAYQRSESLLTSGYSSTILILDVDSVCDENTDSLVEFLASIADSGVNIKLPGLNVEPLRLENIEQLMCWMTSYSTDILETNILETFQLGLAYANIVVVTNRQLDEISVNTSTLLKQLTSGTNHVKFNIWVIDECFRKVRRFKRQSSSLNLYQQLAAQSGGLYISTNKGNISSVAGILMQTTKANTVDIMRFTYSSPPMNNFKVPVDDTMTQLTVLLMAKTTAPICMPMMPLGMPASFAPGSGHKQQNLGTTLVLMELNTTRPTDYGYWKFQKIDTSAWDVKVTGQSSVDFTYQFLQPGPGGFGEYPIKGRPIAGESHKLSITVPQYSKVKSITTALFLDDKNLPSKVSTLTNVGGRRGKSMFYAQITMPVDSFLMAIEGKDKSNHVFRRLDPILVQPISVKLFVPSFSGTKLYKNETIEIPYTVINAASKQQEVIVTIEDDKSFSVDPKSFSFPMKAGTNETGKFHLKGGMIIGETVTLTVTAKPYIKGQNIQGQFKIRRFTVEERPKNKTKDTINPTCNITNIVGTCNIGSDLCACVNHSWSMNVIVGDDGDGLREIFPTGAGSNKSFTYDNFTIGHTINQGVIHASIGADCCHQKATIQVIDKAGNIASCTPNFTQNFKPPDPNHCNSSHLNVTIPCKNSKTTGQCGNFPANPCDCHTKGWHMEVEFGTVGWNLYNAFTVGAGNNASLVRNGNIVELDSDCCHQQITITAEDIAGNIGQCNVSIGTFKTPKPGDCTTTTTSTSTTTTPTTTTTATPSTTTPNQKTTISNKLGTTALSGATGSTAASGGSADTEKNNGDYITTGVVAGAMTGAAVISLGALIIMAIVVWKALSKANNVKPTGSSRRRDNNSWT